MRNKTFILVLLLLSSPSYAKKGPFYPLNFLLGSVRYKPLNYESSIFFQIGWTPYLEIGKWGVRGELTVSAAKNAQKDRFLTSNYELFGVVPLASIFYFEVGGGMETWHADNGGTNPVAALGLTARIGEFVDRLYLNFSYYFLEGNNTQIWRAGYCFNF